MKTRFFFGAVLTLPLLFFGASMVPLRLRAGNSSLHNPRAIVRERVSAAQDSVAAVNPSITLKLSSHLLDLANSVPQQPAAGSGISAAAALGSARLTKSVRDALAGRMMRINKEGEVQVYVLVRKISAGNLRTLQDAGAIIERQDAGRGIIQAHVPVNQLEAIAALPEVKYIREPSYALHFTGSVDTEGDSILKADQVRSLLHVDGTGVKVGVISDGIKGIFATSCTTCGGVSGGPISTGDLPSATGTRNSSGVLTSVSGGITAQSFACNNSQDGSGCGIKSGDLEAIQPGCAFPGAGAEGTALMEIVHDLAPGAQLFFANAQTDLDFVSAVSYIGSHADIGLDDVGYVGLPYDGTSDVSQASSSALNNDSNPLRGYFTAVGNFADYHYLSLYKDSGQNFVSPSGVSGDLHLFQPISAASATPDFPETNDALSIGAQPYDLIKLDGNGEVVIILTWDDPFGRSGNNYDLFLVNSTSGSVVASSISPQTGTQDPVEYVDYINPSSSQVTLHILVQNVKNAAAAKHLNLYIFPPECAAAGPSTLDNTTLQDHNFNTYSQSVPAESDAGGTPVSVTSVGATGDILTLQPVTTSESTTIEPYSSNGPTISSSGSPSRTKPDIVAVDGVSITGAGSFNVPFYGTSAATPHVGGIAALLLQAASCLKSGATVGSKYTTPAQERQELRNLLLQNADPLGSPIPNNIYGYGLVDALSSASGLIPTAKAGAAVTVSGNTATGASLQLDGSGSTDPTGCPLIYNWSGACSVSGTGAAATANCPFGTTTESLAVSNNGVTLSTNPTSVQITITDFNVAASPASDSVTAGTSATYTITAGPTAVGPYTSPIAFSCSNLPTGAKCLFSPASVTPNASPVTTTLTISTTARSAVSPWPFDLLPLAPIAVWIGLGMIVAMFAARRFFPSFQSRGLILGVMAGILAAALLISAACGGGGSSSSGPPPPSGTPAGTYSISVIGTNGSLTHSGTVTLVVQ